MVNQHQAFQGYGNRAAPPATAPHGPPKQQTLYPNPQHLHQPVTPHMAPTSPAAVPAQQSPLIEEVTTTTTTTRYVTAPETTVQNTPSQRGSVAQQSSAPRQSGAAPHHSAVAAPKVQAAVPQPKPQPAPTARPQGRKSGVTINAKASNGAVKISTNGNTVSVSQGPAQQANAAAVKKQICYAPKAAPKVAALPKVAAAPQRVQAPQPKAAKVQAKSQAVRVQQQRPATIRVGGRGKFSTVSVTEVRPPASRSGQPTVINLPTTQPSVVVPPVVRAPRTRVVQSPTVIGGGFYGGGIYGGGIGVGVGLGYAGYCDYGYGGLYDGGFYDGGFYDGGFDFYM